MTEIFDVRGLLDALEEVFSKYDVDVGIGLTSKGVAIRSQDPRVDARNLYNLRAYAPHERLSK